MNKITLPLFAFLIITYSSIAQNQSDNKLSGKIKSVITIQFKDTFPTMIPANPERDSIVDFYSKKGIRIKSIKYTIDLRSRTLKEKNLYYFDKKGHEIYFFTDSR